MTKKILIADDEELIRGAVKLSLRDQGYELYEAKNGTIALEMAKNIKPDLMILDVMMPGIVGYAVSKELKDDPETRDIYILFLTSRGGTQAEMTAMRSGADAYLSKPFEPAQLREMIKKALGT